MVFGKVDFVGIYGKVKVEENSIDPSAVGKNAAKEQKDLLRQKYKELKQEMKGDK